MLPLYSRGRYYSSSKRLKKQAKKKQKQVIKALHMHVVVFDKNNFLSFLLLFMKLTNIQVFHEARITFVCFVLWRLFFILICCMFR